jgi:hypothetical protein
MPDPETLFGVIHLPEGWRIFANGRRLGRFEFRVDAVEAVLRLAREAMAKGHRVQVLVQERFGELQPMPVS